MDDRIERCDGSAESIVVRRLEEQLSNTTSDWLAYEHDRLRAELATDRGLRRKKWLKLQAVTYLIKSRKLIGRMSHG
jgi:hypothetical protein